MSRSGHTGRLRRHSGCNGRGSCYCHALYHWNLPSNPVDLEKREGRIHRYNPLSYLEVWTRFLEELASHDMPVELPEPNSMNQVRIDFARSRAAIGYSFKHDRVRLFWLTRADHDPVALYRWLMANREAIDRELGGVVEWSIPDGDGNGHGLAVFDYDPRGEGSVKEGVAEVARVLRVMGRWVG